MVSAADLAIRVRSTYGSDVPSGAAVDPVRIARQVGMNVYSTLLDPNLSGMIAKTSPEAGVDIFLNSEHSAVRQRFTCAHELGHYFFMEEMGEGAPQTYLHKRDARSACGVYSEEVFANGFAAELLMPAADIRRLRQLGEDGMSMARRFNVSYDAMSHRLTNLNLN